ncbi:MAG: 23S rRNA (uridine(2552)-2'-O)-methyltransferase RlmE [Pseudomonadota bacterium]
MARSKSSKGWLKEHFKDPYVARAQSDGYRSRAVYKLIEIDQRDRLVRPGQRLLELGAAPGGWTEYLAAQVGTSGRVVASDILPMDSVAGVDFVLGDFTEDAVYQRLFEALGSEKCNGVLSDMAPNLSGVSSVDQPRAMYLAELARDIAVDTLRPDGFLLAKVFQGEGYDAFLSETRKRFAKVATRKPDASRDRSREVYVLARTLVL